MSKIYLVSSGSYDDYFINAFFLDKAKAMTYCAEANHGWYSGKKSFLDAYGIEERELKDGHVATEGKTGYILRYAYRKHGKSFYDVSIGFERDVETADMEHKNYSHYFIDTDVYDEAVRIARQMVDGFDKQAEGLT